jgi:cell division septation protein DedD
MKILTTLFASVLLTGPVLAQSTTPTTPPATPPLTPPAAPAAPTASPENQVIGWPPKLEMGQRWVVTIESLGRWDINLNAKDADGDPVGPATGLEGSKNHQAFFFFSKKDNIANLYLVTGKEVGLLCQFSKESLGIATSPTMFGATYQKDVGKPFAALETPCVATWVNSPVTPASLQAALPGQPGATATTPSTTTSTTAPTTTTPTAPAVAVPNPTNGTATDLTAPATALALSWAPKIEIGQQWQARIGNLIFDVDLIKLAAGVATGTAKNGSSTGDAYLFYNSSENRLTLEMDVAAGNFVCNFDLKGVNDKAYTGSAVYRVGTQPAKTLTEKCALFMTKAKP